MGTCSQSAPTALPPFPAVSCPALSSRSHRQGWRHLRYFSKVPDCRETRLLAQHRWAPGEHAARARASQASWWVEVGVVSWLEPRPARQKSRALAPSVTGFLCELGCLFTHVTLGKELRKLLSFKPNWLRFGSKWYHRECKATSLSTWSCPRNGDALCFANIYRQ